MSIAYTPLFSHYAGVKVPEGYGLRHYETGFQKGDKSYRAIVLCRGHRTVGVLEQFRDAATDKWRFGIKLKADGKTFCDYDLDQLFIVACAYDRVTHAG